MKSKATVLWRVLSVSVAIGLALTVSTFWHDQNREGVTSVPLATHVTQWSSVAPQVPLQEDPVRVPVAVSPSKVAESVNSGGWLAAEDMSEADLRRIAQVNEVLQVAGLAALPERCQILRRDLEVFRQVCDDNAKKVNGLEDKWLHVASAAIEKERQQLEAMIVSGQTVGLPVMSDSNTMSRRHPHEAIGQVVTGSGTYVLRVDPRQDPTLGAIGVEYDSAVTARAFDYDTLIRNLFQ